MERKKAIINVSPETWESTRFHCDTLSATRSQLIDTFGNPTDCGDGYDVTHNWDFTIEVDGEKFFCAIYDWKEFDGFGDFTYIDWHIGGKTGIDTQIAESVFKSALGMSDEYLVEIKNKD